MNQIAPYYFDQCHLKGNNLYFSLYAQSFLVNERKDIILTRASLLTVSRRMLRARVYAERRLLEELGRPTDDNEIGHVSYCCFGEKNFNTPMRLECYAALHTGPIFDMLKEAFIQTDFRYFGVIGVLPDATEDMFNGTELKNVPKGRPTILLHGIWQ